MVAGWMRERLWRADDWCAELQALRARARTPEGLFDLAVATEYCDPDRNAALGLYLEAARAGHELARERARALASTLGAYLILAELAQAVGDLVAAGTAFLDAGFPELALAPLQQFVDTKPPGATIASEYTRLQSVSILLAFARRTQRDAESEIARCLELATVPALLHAERVARLAGLTARRDAVISVAHHAFPDDPQIAQLVTSRLFERGAIDELVAHHRARFERAASRSDHVELLRAAGVELLARNVQPGLGLRLLRTALETAYAALLPDIRSHLAAWQLIWTHAKQLRSTVELVPLIVQAFTSPLSEDDAVYLARLGLEIAWRDVGDHLAAQPYAGNLIDFVPDHPFAAAFIDEVIPLEAALPPEPMVSFTKPAPKPASLDDAPVKRSGPASSSAVRTSRIDLLRVPARTTRPKSIPPPQASRLQRNTSPFPVAKRPHKQTLRAERKVVPVDVVVELPTGSFFSSVLRDLSTTGAFVVTKREIEPGVVLSLELRLADPGTLTQHTHRVTAKVARCTELGWGVAFVDASPDLVAALNALA